ncbi:MAG: CCA tRNA nucleotidyltransferase, partial [archaeon]|nr:CCA tRNA nucleotidyltransferase [archaeon]
MVSLAALSRKVLTYIVPSKKERTAEQALCRRIMRTIRKTRGPHKGAVLAGSIARDTHLAGDKDLDIFVYYSPSLKRESFEKHGLKLGHFIFGKNPHEEAYSEHPYVRGNIDGFDVEIVPVFKVGKATEKISAVDRTPFHTSYVKRRLKIYQRNQVRLLKQFFKGIQVYGADTRYQGVPGYLVELLILEYGTFEKALRAMAFWKEGTVIDRENEYGSESEALSLFPGAFLVVVDPTDKIRNVAAALSYNQFARLIMAARSFLNRPRMTFFFGHQEKALPEKELKKRFQTEELIGLHFSYPK